MRRATVTVPRPFRSGGAVAGSAIITEAGITVWDGKRLVGHHPGLVSAVSTADGVEFEAKNGAFAFRAALPAWP